nr:ATPase domain-containing protein [Halovivax sp.]
MSEELDDDWFERALEEREGDDETDAAADVTRLTSSNPSTTEDGSAVDLASSVEAEGEGIADAAAEAVEGDAVEAAGDLAVVDIDPVGMANRLDAIQEELPALIEELGASRPVLDSVSLPEVMYDDRARRRNEISDFAQSLKEAGETALLTSVASADTPYASRYGIVEYLTDSVFVIQYVRPDDFGETRPAVEIRKIRDANHSREERPYEITSDGTSSYQQANLF